MWAVDKFLCASPIAIFDVSIAIPILNVEGNVGLMICSTRSNG